MEIKKFVVEVAVPNGIYTRLDETGIETALRLYSGREITVEVTDVTEFGAVVSGRNGKAEAEL